jgi:hypothetical protein
MHPGFFADYVAYTDGRGTALELEHGGYMAVQELGNLDDGGHLVGPYTLYAMSDRRFGLRAQAELHLVECEIELDEIIAACD